MAKSSPAGAQDLSLLTTKLRVPPARPELIWRPRLMERLNAGYAAKLTLVSAAAGFGKTTLLSSWAAETDQPVGILGRLQRSMDLAKLRKQVRKAPSPAAYGSLAERHVALGQIDEALAAAE